MIFPGELFPQKYKFEMSPAIVLVATNLLVFIFILIFNFFLNSKTNEKTSLGQLSEKDEKIVNEIYLQSLDPIERNFNKNTNLSLSAILRDVRFWHRLEHRQIVGDQVKINEVKDFIKSLRQNYYNSPQFLFGLSQQPTTIFSWITYQFLHTSFVHLLVNMIFLFLVVQILQKFIFDEWIYSVYILSGILGGFFYLYLGDGEIAVLGASGAISGLMSFLVVVAGKKNIMWSYFVSPMKNHFGVIYLPAFLIFPMYLMSDFTTLLFNDEGLASQVANSAHIGGTIAGLVLGLLYLYDKKIKLIILNQFKDSLSAEDYHHLRDDLMR